MTRFKSIAAAVAGLLVMGVADAAQGLPLSFSALYSSTSSGSGQGRMNMSMSGTIFVGDGKVRTEGLDQGHVMAHIIDPTQHTAYMLVPDQGFYEDDSHGGMPALPPDAPSFLAYDRDNPCAGAAGVTCSKQDAASVGDRPCDNWQFNQAGNSWVGCIDRKTGLMLRKQLGNRTFEMHDVRFGAQDPKLFVIPSDLKLGGFTKTRLGPPGGGAPGGGLPSGPPTGMPPGGGPAAGGAPLQ